MFFYIIIISTTFNALINVPNLVEAQVVSHELRRLAISSNQFGIDALKALDRIEPPDRVIVFCPVCLSSSLMMIMMGSSKYQVVSSFRQALYVWSMKPHEINRGFKDIFEHIGLNQQASESKDRPLTVYIKPLSDTRARYYDYHYNHRKRRPMFPNDQNQEDLYNSETRHVKYLSLPKLMRLKEIIERSPNDGSIPWWHSYKENSSNNNNNNGIRKLKNTFEHNSTILDDVASDNYHLKDSSNKHERFYSNQTSSSSTSAIDNDDNNQQMNARDLIGDSSQMSAISNIYIQRGLSMNYNYHLLLSQYYKTVIHPVDFFRNSEETRQHINSLVAANTEGKIKDLVKRTTFENLNYPKIMIISTFHFRGTLDVQIKNQDEHPADLSTKFNENNSSVNNISDNSVQAEKKSDVKGQLFIETEKSLLKYGLFSHLDCSVVEIPFNNRLVSLIIVMPNNHNSTELLITRLSAQVLSDMINSLVVKRISIEIPIIKFDRGPINVDGLLKELGLNHYFFGDQIMTTETGLNKWMRPGDIVHETSIDIGTINPKIVNIEDRLKVGAHDNNEQLGTTTTTTTSQHNSNPITTSDKSKQDSVMKKRSSLSQVEHVKLDKPFFYFVLDSLNGLILTMGRIRQ